MKQNLTNRLGDAVDSIESLLANTGNIVSETTVKGLYTQQGAAPFDIASLNDETTSIRQQLFDTVSQLDNNDPSLSSLTQQSESISAGLMIAAVAGNSKSLGDYHRKAMTPGEGTITLQSFASGTGGELDFMDPKEQNKFTMESFDNNALGAYAARSVLFNIVASRQDKYSEAFFPTKAIAPSEGGLAVTIDRQEVIQFRNRAADGKPVEQARTNLLQAYVNHNILSRPSTSLIPFAKPDGTNDAYLVSDALVATRSLQVGTDAVATRPLLVGKEINMLGISSHPGLLDNGLINTTDQIASGAGVKSLFIRLTDGTDTEVFEFPLADYGNSQFRAAFDGKDRDVQLNFRTDSLTLQPTTKTVAGVPSALLGATLVTPNLVAQLKLTLTGNGNLDLGNFEVNATDVRVARVLNAAAEELALDAGDGLALVNALSTLQAEVIGWDPAFRRSNSNWRTMGDLIDVSQYTEKYEIRPGFPITVVSSTSEEQIGAKLAGMVNAARVRNSNSAVTTLINYAERLAAHQDALARGGKSNVEGMGKYLVDAYYRFQDIDVLDRVAFRRSAELAHDISSVMVDALKDAAYRMYQMSNYGIALDLSSGGADVKPVVVIGCDPVVERYLNITGDTRLLGDRFDVVLVSSVDLRLRNRIFMTFTRQQPGHIDCLGFGTHAFIPEMIQKITTDRDGTTFVQDRVIPRSMHVPVLPVMCEFKVTRLQEAINQS